MTCVSSNDVRRRSAVPDGYSHVYTFGHMKLLCRTDSIDEVFNWAFRRYVGLSVKMVRRNFCRLVCGYISNGWARIKLRWLTTYLTGRRRVPLGRHSAAASIILESWLGYVLGRDNVVVEYSGNSNGRGFKYAYVRLDRAKAFCGCR